MFLWISWSILFENVFVQYCHHNIQDYYQILSFSLIVQPKIQSNAGITVSMVTLDDVKTPAFLIFTTFPVCPSFDEASSWLSERVNALQSPTASVTQPSENKVLHIFLPFLVEDYEETLWGAASAVGETLR